MIRSIFLALFAAMPLVAQESSELPFDVLIRGGSVIDGTGTNSYSADVGIREGRIVAIGELKSNPAVRTLEANGLVVAPGFIDVHAHADADILNCPTIDNFLLMGVTTIITGNCGGSVADLGAHLTAVEAKGVSLNYGSLVGHGTIRDRTMGSMKRAPTAAELESMETAVDRAMRDGAFGLSTGLIYVPGTYAERGEITALARIAGRRGGIYASHLRNEEDRLFEAIEEALTIGREADIPVHLSHVKTSGKENHGRAAEITRRLADARASGQRVTGDQYVYTASSTGLDILFPSSALEGGRGRFAKRLQDDAQFRTDMETALHRTMDRAGFGDFSYCNIAWAPNNRELAGLSLKEAAKKRFNAEDRSSQARIAVDLMIEARGLRVGMVYHKMDEADIQALLKLPFLAVAADAGVQIGSEGRPHPRGFGNNARVLGRYVRELGVLGLPLAVRKMSSLPAEIFGLEGRGHLRVGACADLVLFDPHLVADRATYDDPFASPVGIAYVLVNGRLVVESGKHLGNRPGKVLRHAVEGQTGG